MCCEVEADWNAVVPVQTSEGSNQCASSSRSLKQKLSLLVESKKPTGYHHGPDMLFLVQLAKPINGEIHQEMDACKTHDHDGAFGSSAQHKVEMSDAEVA